MSELQALTAQQKNQSDLAKRVQRMIDENGGTTRSLARLAGIAESTLSNILNRPMAGMSLGTARKLSAATDRTVEWIMTGDAPPSRIAEEAVVPYGKVKAEPDYILEFRGDKVTIIWMDGREERITIPRRALRKHLKRWGVCL